MRKNHLAIVGFLLVMVTACSKKNSSEILPDGSVSIQLNGGKDTMQIPVSILSDYSMVVGLKAVVTGITGSSQHWVNFAVDTTKIAYFRDKYGSALVLPLSSYYFYQPMTKLAAGATVSDSAQINIILQTKLTEYSTYVLPVVVQSVDGKVEGAAVGKVLYLVLKTGKPAFVNKTGWTIAAFSSANGTNAASLLIDNNTLTTYWASNITQTMPQYVTINFGKNIDFVALNYYFPTLLKYPTLGGYPTSVLIETSLDGTTWTNKGTYANILANSVQTLNIGQTTARYLRFTSLAAVKYSSTYDAVFISEISLIP